MVITNMRGNKGRTEFTADMHDATGRLAYRIQYDYTPFNHSLALLDAHDLVVACEQVAQNSPLKWEDVRSWAVSAAHEHVRKLASRR